MAPAAKDPAEARKRRKEIIQSQRSDGEAAAVTTMPSPPNGTNVPLNESVPTTAPLTEGAPHPTAAAADKKPPKKRKIDSTSSAKEAANKKKTQIRYDPDVPMSKEQLAAWRREARRVRNRESAAASRQRIRNRISELEDEVGEWKNKYAQAMQRLEALQQSVASEAGGADHQIV